MSCRHHFIATVEPALCHVSTVTCMLIEPNDILKIPPCIMFTTSSCSNYVMFFKQDWYRKNRQLKQPDLSSPEKTSLAAVSDTIVAPFSSDWLSLTKQWLWPPNFPSFFLNITEYVGGWSATLQRGTVSCISERGTSMITLSGLVGSTTSGSRSTNVWRGWKQKSNHFIYLSMIGDGNGEDQNYKVTRTTSTLDW